MIIRNYFYFFLIIFFAFLVQKKKLKNLQSRRKFRSQMIEAYQEGLKT